MKQLDVVIAVKALIARSVPQAELVGFELPQPEARTVGEHGMIAGEMGEPGDPEVDLSPPAYNYAHAIPLEVGQRQDLPAEYKALSLAGMLAAIGTGIAADRTLGGLCSWLEATAPEFEDIEEDGATFGWASFEIVAHYSTTDPLA